MHSNRFCVKISFMDFLNRLSRFRLILFLWLGVITVGFFGMLLQFQKTLSFSPPETSIITELILPPQPSYFLDSKYPAPQLTSRSVWIYDRSTEKLLYELNAEAATAPASLVKMMTALVAYENLSLEEAVTIGSAVKVDGNRAKFLPQDSFTVRDLLRAMLLFSANDASEALANATASPSAFIAKMNAKAQQFQLQHTTFTNVTGLDDPKQYSSAAELGIIANELLDIPFLAETVALSTAQVHELTTGRIDTIYTTNNMLYKGEEFQGVKTGTTSGAGQNLIFRLHDTWPIISASDSATLTDRDLDLVVVILGSQDRYSDAQKLVNWLQQSLRLTVE
jgi:D-alanyl-D-alanine carboxypeptidase (penicillin-binding protein 5/6)